MSKLNVAIAGMTSFSPNASSRSNDAVRLATLRCETSTPFGRPVEPEV